METQLEAAHLHVVRIGREGFHLLDELHKLVSHLRREEVGDGLDNVASEVWRNLKPALVGKEGLQRDGCENHIHHEVGQRSHRSGE